MNKLLQMILEAKASAIETKVGCQWLLTELMVRYARIQAGIALGFLLLSVVCLMAIPYTIKYVLDAYVSGDKEMSLLYLGLTATVSVLGAILHSIHDHFREKAWNRNYFSMHIHSIHKLFRRTLDEVISEKSEVGAEQIASLTDRAQNIMYLLLFETPIVLATILCSTVFICLIDIRAGVSIIMLTVFNIIWFFFFNLKIDEKMEPIDKAFRRTNRRMVEKLNLISSVKAAGVEQKIEQQIGDELNPPLEADLKIWAYWFQKVDIWRRIINSLVPAVIVYFGITSADWSVGSLAAVSSWVFAVSREYGFIGHLMRHLTSQVARIKAARIALTKEPEFHYDTGIIYKRQNHECEV